MCKPWYQNFQQWIQPVFLQIDYNNKKRMSHNRAWQNPIHSNARADNINKQHGFAVIFALIYTKQEKAGKKRAKVWMRECLERRGLHMFGSMLHPRFALFHYFAVSLVVVFVCQRLSDRFHTSLKCIVASATSCAVSL